MCILMHFKIQNDQPRITRNALKSQIFHLFTKLSSGHIFFLILFIYLCPDNDLVNKSKI